MTTFGTLGRSEPWWFRPAWVDDPAGWRLACMEIAAMTGDQEAMDELYAWSPVSDYSALRAAVEAARPSAGWDVCAGRVPGPLGTARSQ